MTHTNNEILQLFESALAQMQTPEEPELLYAPIIYSMSGGGKRLRPVLLLLTAEAFGGNVEEAMPAALAVEIFHNFTLLHDDIMDNAGLPLLGVVPEDDELPLCLHLGIPILLGSRQNAAGAYRNIASRLQGNRVPLLRIR